MIHRTIITVSLLFALLIPACAALPDVAPKADTLYQLWDGQTKQVNALWGENPPEMKFGDGRTKVVIADIKGPGVITMIHFAMPEAMKLNRDTVMRIYWDGEKTPSVESPLVDFFCDPNGQLERVDSALVNKKRGWNCYFPMPFAKSARVEVSVENPRYPSGSWAMNPCYSYVMYHTMKSLPADAGYFHSHWKQETLLLGKQDYTVFDANGKGQFIGWNATIRGAGSPTAGYVVDENVKFYVDGEKEPSIEWQGIEDSFGFSYGFPEQGNSFPYTGYQPYYGNGAAAYRFTLNDRITFQKSMHMTVGFGKNEHPMFREMFSKPENPLQFSSVAYWYQKEPHTAFPALPPSRERRPIMFATGQTAPGTGETLILNCGLPNTEDAYLATGWDYVVNKGYTFCGSPWTTEINYCWADFKSLEFEIICPKRSAGTLKLFILDGDNFNGGRKQSVRVAGKLIGEYGNFQSGKWINAPISAADTVNGKIAVVMKNLKPSANAVVSQIRFVSEAK